MTTIYLVEGAQGSHDSYSTWIVSAWTTEQDAEAEMWRLTECAEKYEAERDALGKCPEEYDTPEWAAWWNAQNALTDKWRAASGDRELGDEFNNTDYSVIKTILRGPL